MVHLCQSVAPVETWGPGEPKRICRQQRMLGKRAVWQSTTTSLSYGKTPAHTAQNSHPPLALSTGQEWEYKKIHIYPLSRKMMFCFKVLREGGWGAQRFLLEWTNIAGGICLYLIIFKHDLVLQGWVLNSLALFQGAWWRISFHSNTEDVRGWALSLLKKHLISG